MTITRRATLAAALLAPALARAQERQTMLHDLARRAAIYLFPVYEMYRTRWNATANDANPVRGKLNRFQHVPVLATHRSRAVTPRPTPTRSIPAPGSISRSSRCSSPCPRWASAITASPS